MTTDKKLIEAMVQAAGLEKTFAGFPEDVTTAINEALARRKSLADGLDPAVEPWPPMRPGIGL